MANAMPALAAAGSIGPSVDSAEWILFIATLIGVAVFHRHAARASVIGLVAIVIFKLSIGGFPGGTGVAGLERHLAGEWVELANLLGLLLGFAVLAQHFERTRIPASLQSYLPRGWTGPFVLLAVVFLLSGFLDNIAAAVIGGVMAHAVFRSRVHIGYLAGIVAASNAGGAGSVLGDTTTTMIWIHGVAAQQILPAYVGSGVALIVFGVPASIQQHRFSPLAPMGPDPVLIDWGRVAIVGLVLLSTLTTNVFINTMFPDSSESFPWLSAALWITLLATAALRKPDWHVLPEAARGALFLIALVVAASLMPVGHLPIPSWRTALGLGALSAVFDNIPLTALTLKQGGYDWSVIAYSVGVGGSMMWFGSSAGVALTAMYPTARSTTRWLQDGWHVCVAYVIGFVALMCFDGWHPDP